MSGVVHISEAANLGLHAMILMAGEPGRTFRTREAAEALGVSGNHLGKVLNGLVKAGLVLSTRGPSGGFTLGRRPRDIRLIEIYETIEGELRPRSCLLGRPRCAGDCVLGDFVTQTNDAFRRRLARTRLSDVAGALRNLVPVA
jgi:Rrf2 family protein